MRGKKHYVKLIEKPFLWSFRKKKNNAWERSNLEATNRKKNLYACLKVQHLEDCNTSITHPMWTMFTA